MRCQSGKVSLAGWLLTGRPQSRLVPTETENNVCLSEKARTREQRSGLERSLRRRGWRQAQDGGRGRYSEELVPPAAPRAFPPKSRAAIPSAAPGPPAAGLPEARCLSGPEQRGAGGSLHCEAY